MDNHFYVNFENHEIFVRVEGNVESADTILFLHGAAMNSLALDGLSINLKKKYRCVYFDFLGHGKSKGSIPKTIKEYIEFTKNLIYKLKAENILTDYTIIVGYSLGGRLAMDVCIHQFPFVKQALLLHVCDFSLVSVWTQTKKVLKKPHRILSTVFGKDSNPLYIIYRLLHPKNNFLTIFRDFLTIMQSNPIHLNEIKIPITYIISDNDFFCPLDKVKEWHSETPNSKLEILYGKGHTAILEHPEVYSTIILYEVEEHKKKLMM